MSPPNRRRRIAPEPLEERLLAASVHVARGASVIQALDLSGEVSGLAETTRPAARGTLRVVQGLVGDAGAMGEAAAVSTQIETASGEAISGAVVLSNARGSVRLAFTKSDIEVNYDPHHLDGLLVDYKIVGGTGAFAHATGQGELSFKQDVGPIYHLTIESKGS